MDDPWSACARIAQGHYENFTVGSLLLPRKVRRHVWAVYAYCRTVDDLGDEAEGDRTELLDVWEAELRACFAGEARHAVTRALQATIREYGLPMEPFLDLIRANRMDQVQCRYPTFRSLLDYCRLSANPVGRIVLKLFECDDPAAPALSDAVCTALQLTNFWQDIEQDLAKGRIYVPLEDMERFGYDPGLLAERRANDAFRRLMAFEVARTRELFDRGKALLPLIPRPYRADVALFSMGGRLVLDRIERQRYDVFAKRPTVPAAAKAALLCRAVWSFGPWRRMPR